LVGEPDRSDERRQLAEDLGRHVVAAQHGAARVIALVREFAESVQQTSTATEHVNVALALSEALVPLQPDLEKVATIVRDFQPVPLVVGHASKLEQVFSNLLQNALEAFKDASVPQDHRLRLSVCARAEWVVVCVEDTGVGMPESLAQRVFEPFVTTRAASGGTGLGLFICREIVEACGGRLEVKSSPLVGSRFRVWLKAAHEPHASGSLPPDSHRRSKRA
jgi:signal transduction histidine kinase